MTVAHQYSTSKNEKLHTQYRTQFKQSVFPPLWCCAPAVRSPGPNTKLGPKKFPAFLPPTSNLCRHLCA